MTDAVRKYEFKNKLEELRSKSGRGTELVTVYIPNDKQISDVVSQLRDERGQAANIKSKTTRTNVQSALDSILSRLKYINRSPEDGVVIFCGSIDVGGDKTSLETWVLEPPEPIRSYKYHCDSTFLLDPLDEMFRETKTFGLLVLDRREATIGTLRGKTVDAVKHLTSPVPGKQRKGGQSARRFERLREIAIDDFYKRIGNHASDVFLRIDRKDLFGILVGGPSPTKEEFIKGEYLHYEIQEKILGKFDIAYTDESGLHELVDAAGDAVEGLDLLREKKLMSRFMQALTREPPLASYGEEEVRKNLQMGAVGVLLLSEDLHKTRVKFVCSGCDNTMIKTVMWKPGMVVDDIPGETCGACGSEMDVAETEDVVLELSGLADQMSTDVEFISTDFEEGAQLMNAFGGIAAILRFETGV